MKRSTIFFPLLLMAVACIHPKPNNQSFHPGQVWQDNHGVHINSHGGGLFYKNHTYYWYGEHKIAGKSGNTAQVGVHVYSSKDLYHWKDRGIALKVDEIDSTSDIAKGCIIERPKVVFNEKTKKYVMWFHLELKGQGYRAAKTGVAVSDKPDGPFRFIKSYNPNPGKWPIDFKEDWKKSIPGEENLKWWTDAWNKAAEEGLFVRRDFIKGQMARDMTVFVDDDGKAYHIHSSEENQTMHIAELSDDYLEFTGKWARIEPMGANEAPAIFKSKGTYYMITSGLTGWAPNAARSFRAKSIWGPWESLGNPAVGKDAELTFHSQSTYVLSIQNKKDAFIFLADRWTPQNPIDGTYIWLPIKMVNEKPVIEWYDEWNLSVFK